MEVQVITYGVIITTIKVPDRDNILTDVTLGYDTIAGILILPYALI